ncbi:MAG: bifunctional diguanylate cyclase/phosphodiesterase [Rubrivivax sp.]|nr:MAG: bifunctional diguanylate cyclase/phosphodiesterase [Rubrivivax sp.]
MGIRTTAQAQAKDLGMAGQYTNRNPGLHKLVSSPMTELRLEAAEQLNQVGFLMWEAGQAEVRLSALASALLGLPAEVAPSRLLDLVDPEEQANVAARWHLAASRQECSLCGELTAQVNPEASRDATATATAPLPRRFGWQVLCERGSHGELIRCVVALHDITSQSTMVQALSESESRLEEAQQIAQFGYWELDVENRRAVVSDQARSMWNLPPDWDYAQKSLIKLIPEDQRAWVIDLYTQAFATQQTSLRYEVRIADASGTPREYHSLVKIDYRSDGQPRRLLATIQDISELKSYRRQLHSLSFFDTVTGLPNRALFVDRLSQALADAAWHGQQLGLVMLDLDRFKDINDSLGHSAGDALLQQAAQRLQQVMRGYDTVARLGGDEFAVLLPDVRHATDMGSIAQKVLGAFCLPFKVLDQEVFVTASVGGAFYPADAQDADQLLQYADAALYHAKSQGRNNFRFYSKELTRQASERLSLESELRRALEQDELLLHYQPKFDLATGLLVGAEALMRWQHPQRGMVPPLSFISVAEDTGLIVPMGAWALQTACRAAVQWNQDRDPLLLQPLKIAVNLSARQFAGQPFSDTVREALNTSGCRPEWLEIEITESLLLDGRDEVLKVLEGIASQGVSIALDDFGTGYSALSYLTRFPVDTLKIDRSFIKDLPGDRSSAELVKAIVSLGHSLNMNLVAEGVETREQAAHLENLGCQLVQGFLYGKPVAHEAFTALVGPLGEAALR